MLFEKEIQLIFKYTPEERHNIAWTYDKDVTKKFKEVAKNVTLNIKDAKLLDSVTRMVMKQKELYGVPRPFVQSKLIKSIYIPVIGADSPSYPSGHAAVYRLLYLIFSHKDPHNKEKYLDIFVKGALSRVIAGVHTFEDINEGAAIADRVWSI